MKITLNALIVLGVFLLQSCAETSEVIIPIEKSYNDPAIELAEIQEEFNSAENGWIVLARPKRGGVYGMYFDVISDAGMETYSDFNATLPRSSQFEWKVTQSTNPTLVIGTGSSLDLIAFLKDREFSLDYKSNGHIHLIGNTNADELELRPATPEEAENYKSGTFGSRLTQLSGYLNSTIFFYAEIFPDEFVQLQLGELLRGVFATFVQDGEGKVIGSTFYFTESGIQFENPIQAGEVWIDGLTWDNEENKLYLLHDGLRVDLSPTVLPVIPLHYLLGDEYPFALSTPTPNYYVLPGWSNTFRQLWLTDEYQLWQNTGFELYFFDFIIRKDDTMTINIYYVESGKMKIASFPYTYSKDANGIYSFNPMPLDLGTPEGQRANLIRGHLSNLFGVTNDNSFAIDFYDAFDELGGLIAQFQSQENPAIFFTGFFY